MCLETTQQLRIPRSLTMPGTIPLSLRMAPARIAVEAASQTHSWEMASSFQFRIRRAALP